MYKRQVNGNLVMPGFKNGHTHSAMTFLRSYADDLPLNDWLTKQVFPMEAKLSAEDIYHLSKLAIMEYLTSGITANCDMYLTPETIVQASLDCYMCIRDRCHPDEPDHMAGIRSSGMIFRSADGL